MIGPISSEHRKEYPIEMIWYTKHAGCTIERIIDMDLPYFEWMVKTFQLITPKQAQYYKEKTGYEIPKEYIKNVTPYKWEQGDSETLYMELCRTNNLQETLAKYRNKGEQLTLF